MSYKDSADSSATKKSATMTMIQGMEWYPPLLLMTHKDSAESSATKKSATMTMIQGMASHQGLVATEGNWHVNSAEVGVEIFTRIRPWGWDWRQSQEQEER